MTEPHDQTTAIRDPEVAQTALVEIQAILARQRLESEVVHREQHTVGSERQSLVEQLVAKQQHAALQARLDHLHPADIAYILEALPRDDRLLIWDLVRADRDGEILVEVSDAVRETLIASMDREELVAAVETLDTDDLAALAPDLPEEVVEEVSEGLTIEEREQLRAAMSYPEGSVGARMDFEMVTIRDDVTLEVVLRYLRRFDELPDHTDQVFVVDRNEKLQGALPISKLLVHEPETLVRDVMVNEVMTLHPHDDVGDAAQAFERYDLVSAPVLDHHGGLLGRLTVNEVVDVIREEGEQDVFAQAGLREEEDLFSSVWASAKNRWLWLALNLCTAFFASRVIGAFEGTIERVVALAALMPIVAGIAGNSGNQTMTLFIRSIALGQVTAANVKRVFAKELGIAGLNGVVWGSVAGLFAWWLYSDTDQGVLLGWTMMLAILLNLLIGAVIGIFVPLMLERTGRDPAMGSSVLLTFSTDSMGFFIFLGLATLLFA
ncbi:MAG: magnesium transporter [Pseudomonadota bacterium]|jgi:magnesium transporter